MADIELPPVPKIEDELRLVPSRMRDDAIQEAWVAFLEGRCPLNAVKAYCKREKRAEQRHIVQQDDGDIVASDKDNTIHHESTFSRPTAKQRKHKPRLAAHSSDRAA